MRIDIESRRASPAERSTGRRLPVGAALLASSILALPPAGAQVVADMRSEAAGFDALLDALYEACYDAGMGVEALGGDTIVCSTTLTGDERLLEGVEIADVHEGHVRHRIRFALAERPEGIRVWAYPSIEIEEPDGIVLDETIDSQAYLARVRAVLEDIDETLGGEAGGGPEEPWAAHYDSEDDWRLDAHLRAVAHCDRIAEDLSPEQLDRWLALTGVQPFSRGPRGRCEEVYEPVFRWGLARGVEAPTVEAYAEHRATLPPERRACTGRLALSASCP